MTRGWRALFLKPGGYRRRRLHDAARLLPVIGAFLVMLPILWAPAATGARDTAPEGVYLFVVWAGMILAAAAMSGRLADDPSPDRSPDRGDRTGDGPDDGPGDGPGDRPDGDRPDDRPDTGSADPAGPRPGG